MRYLAIGDIHGCYTALTTLADYVQFKPDDTVITLGDVIDRGPDSRKVLDWLIDYQGRANLVALRGNHEVMMLSGRENKTLLDYWSRCGGFAALQSYSSEKGMGLLADIPEAHWDFVNKTRRFYEIDTHFFVHANAYSVCPLEEQPDHKLFWESYEGTPPHRNGKIKVCGHTQQETFRPHNIGYAVCIDTAAYDDGWLTCLDVKSGQYWQANQRGKTRTDWLENAG